MPEQYYDLGYSGDQVNDAIGRMLSGEVEAAVDQAQQYAESAESAVTNAALAAEAAQEASQQIQNMTVEAESVESTQSASVEKTISDEGVVNLKLLIPKGADGKKGDDGDAGKSAYQQAVEGGYTGTEAEFDSMLASGPWLPVNLTEGALYGASLGELYIRKPYNNNAVATILAAQNLDENGNPIIELRGSALDGPIKITNVHDPDNDSDAANKKFVEDTVANAVGSDIIQGNSVVIGPNTSTLGTESVVIGYAARDASGAGIAIGHGVQANGFGAIALGSYAYAAELGSIAIGMAAAGCYFGSVAIGRNSVSYGSYSTALGGYSAARANFSIAIGNSAEATQESSVAIGCYAAAIGSYAVAVGSAANANLDSISIGLGAISGCYSVAIGCYAACNGEKSVALGPQSYLPSYEYGILQLGSNDVSALRCAVALSVTSDIRDKTGVVPIEDGAIKLLEKITPISYFRNPRAAYIDTENLSETDAENRRKFGLCEYDREAHAAGEKKGARRRVGVSAQQVQEALEEVYGSSDYANIVNDNLYDVAPEEIPNGVENQLTVSYEEFVPFLIKAVQELSSRVKELEGSKK